MNTKICRLCCVNNGALNIFDDDKELSLLCKIRLCCVNLKIFEGDGLPTLICRPCETELSALHTFVLRCEASDRLLREQVSTLFQQSADNFLDCEPKVEIKLEENNVDLLYEESYKQEEVCNYADSNIVTDDNHVDSKIKILTKPKRAYKKRARHKVKASSVKCKICARVCATKTSLVVHMRSHTGERPYLCASCDKGYSDKPGLKRHIERVHNEKEKRNKYICEVCGKGFFSKQEVSVHIRSHTGETPHSCTICLAKFSQKSALKRHIIIHTGQKEHACQTCGKKFGRKDKLKVHLEVHTAEKTICCPLCESRFKYKASLRTHMKFHTDPNSAYKERLP